MFAIIMEKIKTHLIDKKHKEVVLEMLLMLRAHSEESYVHSVDVANKAFSIATAMCIKQENLQKLYTAGLLHDIGKICVERSLLHKKNATPEERELIRVGHIEGTKKILGDCFDDDFVRLAVHHHERLNCSGYPEHLNAKNLDVLDRILQVADVSSALEMCRSYKEAYDSERVVSILDNLVRRGELDKRCVQESERIFFKPESDGSGNAPQK